MPTVQRPDGAEIAWYEQGEGRAVVISGLGYATASLFSDLFDELAGDHHAIAYDPRGNGRSSRRGPYELAVDVADLAAVLEEAGAEGAVAVGSGDGADRAVLAATERPDLIAAVVAAGNLGIRTGGEGQGLADSSAVLEGLLTLLEKDYRAGLHAIFGTGNPDLDEAGRHARIEQTAAGCEHEAAVGRIRAWIGNDPTGAAQALGGRLWVLATDTNPWFTTTERTRQLLPEATLREVADGPLSRPDLTAAAVRELTRTAAR